MLIHNAVITGSLTYNGVDISDITGSEGSISALNSFSASMLSYTASNNLASASFSTRVTNLESTASVLTTASASFSIVSQSYASASGSLSTRVTNTESTGSSLVTASGSFSTRVTDLESTGSSLVAASASFSTRTTNLEATASVLTTASASFSVVSASFASTSGSLSTRVTTLESASSSFAQQSGSNSVRLANLESTASVLTTASASFSVVSSSFSSTSQSLSNRVTIVEGSYATTGSNVFVGNQGLTSTSNAISFTSTGSLYIDGGARITKDLYVSGTSYFNNVTIYGTQSVNYITSSQLNIGTNIITVNTDTPTVRYGGLAVYDSGSTGLTGSILWDSENNHWIYTNPSASTYSGGMLISGPRASARGCEVGTTSCAVMMGQGGDHITSSAIFHYGNATCFYGTSYISNNGSAQFNSCVSVNTNNNIGALTVSNGNIDIASLGLAGCSGLVLSGGGYTNNIIQIGFGYINGPSNYAPATIGFKIDNGAGNTKGDLIFATRNSTSDIAPTIRATIFNTGEACFSDTVCANTFKSRNLVVCEGSSNSTIASSNNEVLRIQSSCPSGMFTTYVSGSTIIGDIGNSSQTFSSGNATGFGINARDSRVLQLGTSNTSRITIAATGETTFTCQVCAPSFISSGTSCFNGCVNVFTGNQIRLYNSAKNNWVQIESPLLTSDAAIDFKLSTATGVVYMNSTGITCFNNTVCTPALVVNKSNPVLYINAGNSETSTIGFTQPAVAGYGGFIKVGTGLGDRAMTFGLSAAGTNNDATEVVRIDDSGVTCFSSNVCAPTMIVNNCINIGTTTSLGSRLSIESCNDQAGVTMYNSYDCNKWSLRTGTTGISNKGFGIVDDICNATRIQINGAGNVGIGTLSIPSDHILQIHNPAAYARMALTNNSTGVASGDGLIFQVENCLAIIKNQETSCFVLGTNGRETDIVIDTNGGVGIGQNPINKFTILAGNTNVLDLFDTGAGFGIGMQAMNSAATVYRSWDFYASKYQFFAGQAIFSCQVCAPQYITTQGSSVSYADGSNYLVWSSEGEYSCVDNNTNCTLTTMKTWIADRTGCVRLKFAGYISSGPTYWGWRIYRNGTSAYTCQSYATCLETGCSANVHGYTTFSVGIGPVNPGDCITLQMVSTGGGSVPAPGQGQTLYAKEFRIYSTTPNFSAGSPSNIFGDWVGIGTNTPYSNLYINGNNDAAYDATVDNGQDGCGVTLTVRNNSTVTNSFAQLNLQASGDSGRSVGRIVLIRKGSATGDMAFVTEDSNTKAEKLRITSTGNVGIGTCAPNAKLTVWTPSTTGLQTALRLNNPFGFDNLNTGTQIVFSQDRSVAEDLKQGIIAVGQADAGTSATSYMAFYTNNTGLNERLRIMSTGIACFACTVCAPMASISGCIGIGTNPATYTLKAGGRGYFFATNQDAGWGMLTLDYGNGTNGNIYAIQMAEGGAINAALGFGSYGSSNCGDLVMWTNDGGGLVERSRMYSNGAARIATMGSNNTTILQKSFSVGAGACVNVCFDIFNDIPGKGSGYVFQADMHVSGYGSAGASGLLYKASVAGYDGHHVGIGSYHKDAELVKCASGVDVKIYNPAGCSCLLGITIYNCSGTYVHTGTFRMVLTY